MANTLPAMVDWACQCLTSPHPTTAPTLQVSIDDGDGGTVLATFGPFTIANVAPQNVTIATSATNVYREGSPLQFTGSAIDPAGPADTLTYQWSVELLNPTTGHYS